MDRKFYELRHLASRVEPHKSPQTLAKLHQQIVQPLSFPDPELNRKRYSTIRFRPRLFQIQPKMISNTPFNPTLHVFALVNPWKNDFHTPPLFPKLQLHPRHQTIFLNYTSVCFRPPPLPCSFRLMQSQLAGPAQMICQAQHACSLLSQSQQHLPVILILIFVYHNKQQNQLTIYEHVVYMLYIRNAKPCPPHRHLQYY